MNCGIPSLSHIFTEFFMELCYLFTECCIINMPQDFPPKLKLIFSLSEDGFEKSFSLTLEYLEALLPPHVLPLYVPDRLLAHEIAYQTCGVGGMRK